MAAGTVMARGSRAISGNYIYVNHGNGIITRYYHLSGFACSVGQKVNAGQLIGYVGSTGRSTGPHLHFEIRINGTPVNGLRYFR
jgi:murein DD-endopeptidase MepM/ murein hydrolase activator NlpD